MLLTFFLFIIPFVSCLELFFPPFLISTRSFSSSYHCIVFLSFLNLLLLFTYFFSLSPFFSSSVTLLFRYRPLQHNLSLRLFDNLALLFSRLPQHVFTHSSDSYCAFLLHSILHPSHFLWLMSSLSYFILILSHSFPSPSFPFILPFFAYHTPFPHHLCISFFLHPVSPITFPFVTLSLHFPFFAPHFSVRYLSLPFLSHPTSTPIAPIAPIAPLPLAFPPRLQCFYKAPLVMPPRGRALISQPVSQSSPRAYLHN